MDAASQRGGCEGGRESVQGHRERCRPGCHCWRTQNILDRDRGGQVSASEVCGLCKWVGIQRFSVELTILIFLYMVCGKNDKSRHKMILL